VYELQIPRYQLIHSAVKTKDQNHANQAGFEISYLSKKGGDQWEYNSSKYSFNSFFPVFYCCVTRSIFVLSNLCELKIFIMEKIRFAVLCFVMLAAIPVLMYLELSRKETRKMEQKEEVIQGNSAKEKQAAVIIFSPMLRMQS
jgi:hypothetical protein